MRTRHRSPHTNDVVERWFETLKFERLYHEEIPRGIDLAESSTNTTQSDPTKRSLGGAPSTPT